MTVPGPLTFLFMSVLLRSHRPQVSAVCGRRGREPSGQGRTRPGRQEPGSRDASQVPAFSPASPSVRRAAQGRGGARWGASSRQGESVRRGPHSNCQSQKDGPARAVAAPSGSPEGEVASGRGVLPAEVLADPCPKPSAFNPGAWRCDHRD